MNKKKIIFKSAYFLVSSIFCLGTLEIFSRLIRPIFPGAQKIDAMGKRLEGVPFNSPGASYFQYSSEYKVKTNVDMMGNRITPSSKNKSQCTKEHHRTKNDSKNYKWGNLTIFVE